MPSNLAAVRKLVSVAFSDEELTTFCFDHFRAVFEEFTAGQTKGQRVLSLVGFAERRGLLDALLDKVKKANPHQFALFEANLQADQGREAYTKLETKPFEPETMLIPGGPFLMGSPPGPGIPESETPQHTVDLPDYRIGRYPVTNWQYAEFVRREKTQDAPKEAGWFLREPPADRLDHPVTGVIWHDAVAYCRWLSAQTGRCYRLPSEAEWEKAASWVGVDKETSRQVDEGRKRRYPWGDAWDPACANAGSGGTTPDSSSGRRQPLWLRGHAGQRAGVDEHAVGQPARTAGLSLSVPRRRRPRGPGGERVALRRLPGASGRFVSRSG